jgi:hypothetical protein
MRWRRAGRHLAQQVSQRTQKIDRLMNAAVEKTGGAIKRPQWQQRCLPPPGITGAYDRGFEFVVECSRARSPAGDLA